MTSSWKTRWFVGALVVGLIPACAAREKKLAEQAKRRGIQVIAHGLSYPGGVAAATGTHVLVANVFPWVVSLMIFHKIVWRARTECREKAPRLPLGSV